MIDVTTKAPFRGDQVGSLLRPARLHETRAHFEQGAISAEQLRDVENEEIKRAVDKQLEAGLPAVTDGEFRRRFFNFDFMENLNGFEAYTPEQSADFNGEKVERHNIQNTGRISFNPHHPFIQDVKDLIAIVGGRAEVKFTLPSPNLFFNDGTRNPEIYPELKSYADDLIQTFYDAGLRYLQLDDVYISGLAADYVPWNADPGDQRDDLIDLAVQVLNESLANKPDDLAVTVHMCRGNYRSSWAYEGGSYDRIASKVFAEVDVDGFFLEYDDERSGGFEPLAYIPEGGPRVILGLITSKSGELEAQADVIAQIHEAAQYVPIGQLGLSPQCGFASTHHGNKLTEEEQWAKLVLVADTAQKIWGSITGE